MTRPLGWRVGRPTATIIAFVSVALLASGCGSSSTSADAANSDTSLVSIPNTIAFAEEESDDNAVSEDLEAPASTTTSQPVASTAASNSVQAEPPADQSTTATSTVIGPATCSTTDYEAPLLAGWYSIDSVLGSCSLFATIPSQSLECDCTVGVSIRSYPNQDAASRVSDWISTGAGSAPPTSTSVLGGAATLVSGEWELSEVQTGGSGQTEQRYMYVFDDGVSSVEVSAGEFQDWGGSETFADRKAAVDQIAAGLVLK